MGKLIHGALPTALWVQPCLTTTFSSFSSVYLSTHLSSLPVRSSAYCHARPQPYLTSTQTYTHLNKLPPAYITSTARSRHSPTHLSLLTAILILCGDIQPNPGPTHQLIDSTPYGYSHFAAPRSYTGNPSKPILAGGTVFLIKEPFIQNSAAHHYSSFEYSSITRLCNAIDYPKFMDDLNLSPLITNPPSCLPDLLDSFFTTLRSLLDHQCPSPHQNQ